MTAAGPQIAKITPPMTQPLLTTAKNKIRDYLALALFYPALPFLRFQLILRDLAVLPGIGKIGVERQHFVVIGERVLIVVYFMIGESAAKIADRICLIQLDGVTEIDDRFAIFADLMNASATSTRARPDSPSS